MVPKSLIVKVEGQIYDIESKFFLDKDFSEKLSNSYWGISLKPDANLYSLYCHFIDCKYLLCEAKDVDSFNYTYIVNNLLTLSIVNLNPIGERITKLWKDNRGCIRFISVEMENNDLIHLDKIYYPISISLNEFFSSYTVDQSFELNCYQSRFWTLENSTSCLVVPFAEMINESLIDNSINVKNFDIKEVALFEKSKYKVKFCTLISLNRKKSMYHVGELLVNIESGEVEVIESKYESYRED